MDFDRFRDDVRDINKTLLLIISLIVCFVVVLVVINILSVYGVGSGSPGGGSPGVVYSFILELLFAGFYVGVFVGVFLVLSHLLGLWDRRVVSESGTRYPKHTNPHYLVGDGRVYRKEDGVWRYRKANSGSWITVNAYNEDGSKTVYASKLERGVDPIDNRKLRRVSHDAVSKEGERKDGLRLVEESRGLERRKKVIDELFLVNEKIRYKDRAGVSAESSEMKDLLRKRERLLKQIDGDLDFIDITPDEAKRVAVAEERVESFFRKQKRVREEKEAKRLRGDLGKLEDESAPKVFKDIKASRVEGIEQKHSVERNRAISRVEFLNMDIRRMEDAGLEDSAGYRDALYKRDRLVNDLRNEYKLSSREVKRIESVPKKPRVGELGMLKV